MDLIEKKEPAKALLEIVGINIIRKRGKMSQQSLADKAKVGLSTVKKIEGGKNISLKNLIKIANALGIETPNLFLSDDEKIEVTYKLKLLMDMITEFTKTKK